MDCLCLSGVDVFICLVSIILLWFWYAVYLVILPPKYVDVVTVLCSIPAIIFLFTYIVNKT